MNKGKVISLCIALGLGAAIWALSPLITGNVEPWDGGFPYYIMALILVGAIIGGLIPRNLWMVFIGVYLGQMIYMLIFIPSGPLLPLGMILLAGYSMISFVAALFAARIRRST
jgi:hypothetical protein